ncbi:MAG: sn-glycerol-3-phosphate ABC transporter ATP-binding protein UgpC [Bauldia litoralis]
MASVVVKDLYKSYGDTEVLHGVNIDIENGEFVTLVGPSGCGKSTLLRMVAGLEDVTGGEIRIGDKVVNLDPPKDRDIAMVFQNYALYPHMSVERNMGFALRLSGVAKDEIAKRVGRTAEILKLESLLKRLPRQLSGGQRQRVAMGRAIVRDPKVFLFDEPLSNLDAKLRVRMRAEIKELHQRLSSTTIYVTHDQIEAMTMADKIVVMQSGNIEQIGSPVELYDRPNNIFVAGFIGSPAMNFLGGRCEGGTFVTGGGRTIQLGRAIAAPADREMVLGVRPEDLTLAADGADEGVLFPSEARVVEPTGAEEHVVGSFEGEEIVAVLRGRHGLKSGQAVRFTAEPAKLHVFDAASGKRMG